MIANIFEVFERGQVCVSLRGGDGCSEKDFEYELGQGYAFQKEKCAIL